MTHSSTLVCIGLADFVFGKTFDLGVTFDFGLGVSSELEEAATAAKD